MGNSVNDITRVYQMLEDEKSKDIYLKRLNYLITYDFSYIQEIVSDYLPQLEPWNGETITVALARLPQDKDFVLYGAGKDGALMLPYCKYDKRFSGFCCRTEDKQRNGYLGYPVMSPERLLSQRNLSVIVSTTDAKSEIMQILREGNYPSDFIFDGSDFIQQTIIDPEQYFGPAFMKYDKHEVFIDAGCYDMGTTLELKKRCGTLKKVYAFEPDKENYARCAARVSRMEPVDVKLLPMGTWSEKTTLHFDALGTGSSRVAENLSDTVSVPVMPIDEAVDPKDKITFIKMDVEGAELESLKGAQKTIQRDKPKLAICIYHKAEDMTEIPLYIKGLVPEYKLYVRHHSNSSGETVLYAIP